MSESTKLFPDGSVVRLLVGIETTDGHEIDAGATGIVASVSEEGRSYVVTFADPAGTSAVVEAGSVILD